MAHEYRAKGAPRPRTESPAPRGPHKYRHVFHGPPVTAPGGHVPFQIPEEFADDLGRHVESCGFWSHRELVARADENGMLNVAELPGATIRQDPPPSGPRVWGNFGPWVPVSTPAPAHAVPEVANLDDLTDEQAEAARLEAAAVQEGLRRRARGREMRAQTDPRSSGERPGGGNVGGETA